jgi:hypothetical protein
MEIGVREPNPKTLQLQQTTAQIVEKVVEEGLAFRSYEQQPLLNDLFNYDDFFPTVSSV